MCAPLGYLKFTSRSPVRGPAASEAEPEGVEPVRLNALRIIRTWLGLMPRSSTIRGRVRVWTECMTTRVWGRVTTFRFRHTSHRSRFPSQSLRLTRVTSSHPGPEWARCQ